MRVPDWPVGGCGGTLGCAFIPRRKYGGTIIATVACLRVDLYTTLGQSDRAVAVCLEYLKKMGIEWSPHPTVEEGRREYEQIWSQLGNRAIEDLIELPLMSDPASLATLDVLTKALPPALYTDANLLSLAICRMVNLSLERGNSDGSCFAYVMLGIIAGPRFGNYNAGFRFGSVGYELVEKRGLKRFQARTYSCFGCDVMPWTKHFRVCRDLLRRAFEAQLKSTGILQPYEREYFRNDGTRVPVLIGAAIFEESQNEGVAFVLDLSEQKRAEEALRQSQARLAEAQAELAHVTRLTTLGEMTASIAHEISQPLTAIATNANASVRWLAKDSPNLTEAREAIGRIIRDGNRASNVISRMRALFKKAPAAKEPLDINEVMQEVLTLTQTELQRNRVSLRTQFANDLPIVIGDKIQLQQVILNLVVNAIEAMSGVAEGPRELCVSSQADTEIPGEAGKDSVESNALTEPEAAFVLIAVRDSGPGLDSTELKRVFDTFYTTKSQGMGLGLAISRSIIAAHRGRLWVTTNAPKGAVFQFTLPCS